MRRTLIVAALLLAVPLAGCAQGGDAPAEDGGTETHDVAAVDNDFEPAQLSVSPGDEVVWTNEGEIDHTVEVQLEGEQETLHSEEIEAGQSTSFTFDDAGTYDVWCRFHGQPGQGMAMTVTVE